MKRFISIFLSIAVAVTLFPALSVYGTDESAVDASAEIAEQIADQFGDPSADPFDYTQRSAKRKAVNDAKSLPAKYDLRDVEGTSYVTHVKLQNPFGNCWGFAAICAAETSILGDKNNITSLTADTIDLSEKHLSYFAGTPINDPDNPQNGEGVIGGKTVADIYDYGGMALTATSLFSSGVGPVLESEDTVLEYKGRRGLVDKDYINNILQNY